MSVDAITRTRTVTTPDKLVNGARAGWSALWPKLLAVAIALALWQLVSPSALKPDFLLPPPATTLGTLKDTVSERDFWRELYTTLHRGVFGFGLSVIIGSLLGIAVSQSRVTRLGAL